MDVVGWLVLGGAVAAGTALAAMGPWLMRDHRRRRQAGGGGGISGIGGGFDAVWRPTAEEARAEWESQIEVLAPTPNPGDTGRISDGRVVLDGGGISRDDV